MPYLGSTLFVATLVLAFGLGMVGYFALARALWPQWVKRAQDRWTQRPISTVLAGAGIAVPAVTMCVVIAQGPGPLAALGIIALGLVIGVALIGASGFAARIGARLPSAGDPDRPWMQTVRGGVVLELSCLVPIIGWFVILPLAVVGGLGAAVLGLRTRALPDAARPRRSTQPIRSAAVNAPAA